MTDSEVVDVDLIPTSDARKKTERIRPMISEPTYQQVKKFQESLELNSESAAIRMLIEIGLRSYIRNDPRDNAKTSDEEDYSPLTLRDVLPNSREDALNLRDNEVLELLDEQIPREVQNDPKIQQDGWSVWTTK